MAGYRLVSKDYSATHALAATTGAAVGIAGLSRSRAGMGMVARGVNRAGYNSAYAYSAARNVRAATEPVVVWTHRSRGIGGMVDLIPRRFRPALAMGLGASLVHREAPLIRRP